MVKVEPLQVDDVEPLHGPELQSFLNSVRTGTPPEVTADDGVAAVELAERIVAAALKEKQWELTDTVDGAREARHFACIGHTPYLNWCREARP